MNKTVVTHSYEQISQCKLQ